MHVETKEHQEEPEAEFASLGSREFRPKYHGSPDLHAIRPYVRLRRAMTRGIGLGALIVSAITFLVALLG